MTEEATEQSAPKFGKLTMLMSDHCDNCALCKKAEKAPDSTFGKIINWHHSWCPSWKAHEKVHGEASTE